MDLKTVTMVVGEINPFFPFLLLAPLLFLIFKRFSPKCPPLPPGPYPLPIIGNILQMRQKPPHIALSSLAEVYGPLMSLRFGKQLVIVGSSPAAAKEILKTHDRILSGRYIPDVHPAKDPKLNYLTLGFASECTDQWKYLKSICRTELFSTKALESQVELRGKKVMEMVEFLGAKEGQAVKVGEIVFATTLNILSNIFFSMDFMDFEGKGIGGELRELMKKNVVLLSAPNVSDFYPILSGLDVQGIEKKFTPTLDRIYAIWEHVINERRKPRANVSSQRDFLDTLFEIGFNNDQINLLILELFGAGTDTSSSTVEWLMAELLRNQKAMHKLRDELTSKIGKNIVRESHLPHLPYLQACVKETLRLYPPAGTLLLPHRALEACQVMGYTIPKDSKIIVNLWALGRDPTTWDDPLSFKPERFLNSGLDFIGNDLEYIPFGAGRRMCPGLPLATRQVPLIIASLVHLFDWVLPDNMDPAKLNMNEKLVMTMEMEQRLHLVPKARN